MTSAKKEVTEEKFGRWEDNRPWKWQEMKKIKCYYAGGGWCFKEFRQMTAKVWCCDHIIRHSCCILMIIKL